MSLKERESQAFLDLPHATRSERPVSPLEGGLRNSLG